MKLLRTLFLGTVLLGSPPAFANIDIVFDYRHDSINYFDSSRRTLLDAAAATFESRFTDSLTAITTTGSDNFVAKYWHPNPITRAQNSGTTPLGRFSVAANQIVVFVGAHDMKSSDLLAWGVPGDGTAALGSQSFKDNAVSRGQSGALGTPATQTDFGLWGGSIAFNSTMPFYVDNNPATDETFEGPDFYTIALHELGHVLGFGASNSYFNHVSQGLFTGDAVTTLTNSSQPVSGAHWADGLTYDGLPVAMGPFQTPGVRKRFTELDFAAMKDIGWQVSAVPESNSWGLMLAGIALLGWRMRSRVGA